MLIKSVIIENFRGYHTRQVIEFSKLTAFVGKNDVGKSTVLEALDIFFNDGKGAVKLEPSDINAQAKQDANGQNVDIVIGVEFDDLPGQIVIDDNNNTTLAEEYLLNGNQNLTILKRYPNAGKAKVFIWANHPAQEECKGLLYKKQADLRRMTANYDCDHNKNAEMRAAIRRQHANELNLTLQEIDASKEDAKNIWEQLGRYMPVYSLFQVDRTNDDKNKEVQDPLKEAVKVIMGSDDIKQKCQEIYDAVMQQLTDVATRTLQKVNEMNPHLANTLHPYMPLSDSLGWNDVFKGVSITGDGDIPINKRGSGVKRLILINFFRAEAERRQQAVNAPGVIYAIEEPETSQHTDHQKILVNSLLALSQLPNTQVVITTHSSNVLKCLAFDNVRLIRLGANNEKLIENLASQQLPYRSLNEIAYVAFDEATEEYHDELYNFIESQQWGHDYRQGRATMAYQKIDRHGNQQSQQIVLSEYIRHQIHHGDNNRNIHYTPAQLASSIAQMRQFIDSKLNPQP